MLKFSLFLFITQALLILWKKVELFAVVSGCLLELNYKTKTLNDQSVVNTPMEQTGIKAVLSGSGISNEWEEPLCSDLPELMESIRKVKQSVNDYLTDLVNGEKGDKSCKSVENSEDEEEDVEDTISGFIKEATVSEEVKKGKRRRQEKMHIKVQKAKKRK